MKSNRHITAVTSSLICLTSLFVSSGTAFAWGDEGHEVVALIAYHYLDPGVRTKVNGLLAGDSSKLTAKDITHEATWADKYRDSDRNTTRKRYNQTHNWHFVDLELMGADLSAACFGQPTLRPGTVASNGPARDCVVDKIDEFAAELGKASTTIQERRRALQFLLHFVGDVHQPLHASDDHDSGGNQKQVSTQGIAANSLHHYWDTEFVRRLGPDDTQVAQQLIAKISKTKRARWSKGRAADWAMESFDCAKQYAYGPLPAPTSSGHYVLAAAYVNDATDVVAEQLSKAGVRLAFVLNKALK